MSELEGTHESAGIDTDADLEAEVRRAGAALLNLGSSSGKLAARPLARLLEVVAQEATRSPRFAKALVGALEPPIHRPNGEAQAKRSNRRAPGIVDPYMIFNEGGEEGLRSRLAELSLDQLKDIIAEHGMDQDKLAMKWKDQQRVIDRIVERVSDRAAKGSAFRQEREAAASEGSGWVGA